MEKKELRQIATELKKKILSYCPNTEKIILFGSYARGDNTDESDMDIMIVIADSRENMALYRDTISDISSDLSLKYDILLSVIIRDADYFQRGTEYIPFYQNIAREGVKLYDRAA